MAVPGVVQVHDLHVWEVTSGFPSLAAYVLVGEEVDCHRTREKLEQTLHDQFDFEHATLRVDHVDEGLLQVEPPPVATGSP